MTDYPQIPIRQSFSVIVSVTTTLPASNFADWLVHSQIRKMNNNQPSGLIADLQVSPIQTNEPNELQFLIYHEDTSAWPIGLAEIDLAFVHPQSGHTLMTQRRAVEITRSVTKNV